MVRDQKGRDPHVVSRLAAFIRENGVQQLVYKSDQEPSIVAMAQEAIKAADLKYVDTLPKMGSTRESPGDVLAVAAAPAPQSWLTATP